MPRFARVVIPECPHHVTQRGNERRDIFFSPTDREVYLGLLKHYAQLYHVDVLGFCLMTNHVHLVLVPHQPELLAKLLRYVQMRYSQYRHALERGSGHLWQSRYYSCPVQPERLGSVMRYLEMNPVRAGLIADAAHYPWSSAAIHLGADDPWGLLAMTDWRQCWTAQEWRLVLKSLPRSAKPPTADGL
jgi:putative transposase